MIHGSLCIFAQSTSWTLKRFLELEQLYFRLRRGLNKNNNGNTLLTLRKLTFLSRARESEGGLGSGTKLVKIEFCPVS